MVRSACRPNLAFTEYGTPYMKLLEMYGAVLDYKKTYLSDYGSEKLFIGTGTLGAPGSQTPILPP